MGDRTPPAQIRSEEWLADFVDTAAIGLHWVGADGTILWANASDYEPLGYTAEEYIGHDIRDFHADAAVIADILDRLRRGERIEEHPARLRAKDGSIRHVTISSSALFDDCGEFIHTRCFTRDVTARVAAEQRAESERALLALVADALPVLVSFVGADECYRLVNHAYEHWFGLRREEIVGQSLSDTLGAAAYATIRPYVKAALSGRQVTYEASIPYRGGPPRDVRATYVPQTGKDGAVTGFAALVSDVTAEKQAQRRLALLAEASAIFARETLDPSALAQAIAEQLALHVGDACIIHLVDHAAGALQLVASSHRDPAAEACYRRGAKSTQPFAESIAGEVAASGRPVFIADVVTAELGKREPAQHREYLERFPPRSLLVLPMAARERVVGVIAISRHDTPEPHSEEDRKLARDLADRAGMAIDLAQSFERERQAVRARDEFLSVAGHELRTPLAALLLQVQGLLLRAEGEIPSWFVERLHKTERHAGKLAQLIEELLDVSRIADGRLKLAHEQVDLSAVCREVVERHTEQLARARSPVTLDADEAVEGSWDRARLEQVVSNLLENAIKYGANKPITVSLRATATTARLEIRDQGIGIPVAEHQRIFGRFERAVSERNYGGLGLGLWITRQIVEAFGGTISCQSAEEAGSTFVVELPRHRVPPVSSG